MVKMVVAGAVVGTVEGGWIDDKILFDIKKQAS